MQNAHIDFLKYFKNVLGIKHFDFIEFCPVNGDSNQDEIFQASWELGFHVSSQNHVLFLISGQSWEVLASDEKELFLKVRAAMKLNSQIQAPAVVADWNESNLELFISALKSPVELILFENDKSKLEKSNLVKGDHSMTVIPSLNLMLSKQDYKKQAWERLKTLAIKIVQAY
jgi:hypothetical protein